MARILAVITSGVVSNMIVGDAADFPGAIDVTDMASRPSIGWRYSDGNFTPTTGAPGSEPTPRRITNLAFDLRFTADERVRIELASMDDPAADEEARVQAAHVRVALQRADKAQYTDLDDPVTRAGVEQFEAMGLIDEGRAAEILDGPISDRERA